MSGGGNESAAHGRVWPVWLVWAILAGASLIGCLMAGGMESAQIAAIAAVVLAAIKVDLVFTHYMELEWRHRPLRLMMAAWLAAVTAILLGGYLLS